LPYKRHQFCFILLTFAMYGCQQAVPVVESIPVGPALAQSSAPANVIADSRPDPEPQRIAELLEAGHTALRQKRLTTPDSDNAYLRYSQVLILEPDHPAALLGLAEIVEAYLDLAIDQAKAGKLRTARNYLTMAQSVDPDHSSIPAIALMIAEQQNTQKVEYLLPDLSLASLVDLNRAIAETAVDTPASAVLAPKDQSSLGGSDLPALNLLQVAAEQIELTNASILISASSDALGRQIYQYLNQATSKRIRAQFEMSNRTAISLYWH